MRISVFLCAKRGGEDKCNFLTWNHEKMRCRFFWSGRHCVHKCKHFPISLYFSFFFGAFSTLRKCTNFAMMLYVTCSLRYCLEPGLKYKSTFNLWWNIYRASEPGLQDRVLWASEASEQHEAQSHGPWRERAEGPTWTLHGLIVLYIN